MRIRRHPARIRRCVAATALSAAAFLLAHPGGCRISGSAEAAPAEEPIRGQERNRTLERIREQQKDIAGLRATVVQRKRHPLLKAEAVTEGTLLYQKPSRLRWEVERPERVIIVVDGDSMISYYPDKQEAERRELGGDFGSRAALEFLASGMRVSVPELEKRFQVDLFRGNGQVLLKLIPRSRWLSHAIAAIAIHLDDDGAVPRQIVVIGAKGERTETALTNVTLNPQSSDDPFALRLGPEVRITDVGKPAGGREDGR